ncbi:DEAD/DEAH box helicase [Acinetobacter wuhouensis]|uniref:Heavy metal resistance protein CzcA n=1 Tax=Acinetobacter wuhouensis TaxID=1879050 RepID=A0A3G2T626_9GAMM|nr:DEAD/DEAH box helicase [Acinetobacter wuhouensis]AYO55531.1 heavy metal resistance protein CzcA [Acinetobacter wuhouensis]
MATLNQFLSRFSTATIQRSVSYVKKIDLKSLEIYPDRDNLVIEAQVQGTDYYETAVIFNPLKNKIVDTDCSCPVGIDCKHAAALARYFYDHQGVNPSAPQTIHNTDQTQATKSNPKLGTAKLWLEQFRVQLQQIKHAEAHQHHQLIYIFQPKNGSTKLQLSVFKTRRNKDGKVRDTTLYTSYDNVLNEKLKVSKQEKKLFSSLYFFAKQNFNNAHFYPMSWDISGIYQDHLKTAIQTGEVYCLDIIRPALTWSEETYRIEFNWQSRPDEKTEKLKAQFFDQDDFEISTEHAKQIYIVHSQPPSYLDISKNQIGALDSTYSSEMIDELINMPQMPVELLAEFEQVIQPYPVFENLPQAQFAQNIETLTGKPTPILRFGTYPQYDRLGHMHHYAIAEIEFEYPAGRIKAGFIEDNFITNVDEKTIKQQRDLNAEKSHIDALMRSVKSSQWISKIPKSKRPAFDAITENSIICADPNAWISQLLPDNKIELLGWKVEHTKDSLFNLKSTQNMQLALTESEQQQDWFNVGATIQDMNGNTYNLIDLLGYAVERNPHLLEDDYIDELNEDGFIVVYFDATDSQLALKVKDIKPILVYLKEILRHPESASLDQYDAAQFLDLQHHLGMPWHTNERLQLFVDKLVNSYQQHIPTPKGFQGELRPYQQQGLAWLQFLRETEHGGVLADDMGLGKTAQTLAHILLEKQAGRLNKTPALIIAPTSLMHNWRKEAEKFTPELKVLVLQGHDRLEHFQEIQDADIVLSTYPLLGRDEEFLLPHQYHLLILDEAQNIKNPRAKASQVVRQLKAKHRLCLTGTPMENHLGELWSLFHFLMPGFLYSQELFNKKYRNPIEKHADINIKNKLVSRVKPFMLRRLKTEVAKELPEKTTIEVNIDMNEQQSKLYEAVRATMQKNIRELIQAKGFHRSQIQILSALLKLRQVCCHPSLLDLDQVKSQNVESAKLEQLLEMVQGMVEEGRKILIFSQFTTMLQLIENHLKTLKIKSVKLTGQTKKRDEVITAFQSGDIPVFLISLKAGGVGLNLTAADTVIHYDPWWNPAAEDQASDRAWRIGQDKPVFVYKLITNQSIEEKILALQHRKADLAKSILSIDHENEVKLSEDDVMSLLD